MYRERERERERDINLYISYAKFSYGAWTLKIGNGPCTGLGTTSLRLAWPRWVRNRPQMIEFGSKDPKPTKRGPKTEDSDTVQCP